MASLRTLSGLSAVGITNGCILLAVLVSPSFSFAGNALSNLGVASTAAGTGVTALLFNGGLVAGGLLGLAFAWTLFEDAATPGGRAVASLLGLTVLFLGLVGVFPQDRALHFPVAAGFYLFVSVTLWADGVARWRAGGDPRAGLALGTLNVAGWVAWTLTGPFQRPGLAVPELVGSVAFSVWVLLRVRE